MGEKRSSVSGREMFTPMTADAAQQLSTWLEQFDYHRLQHANDVRMEFVLPLFRQLGYPESVCRLDYPVGKGKSSGRKKSDMAECLSGKHRKKLVEALVSAFPTYGQLEQMVSFELDESLQAIAGSSELNQVAFNLVKNWATPQGKIQELVEAALASNPDNPKLNSFVQELNIPVVYTASNDATSIVYFSEEHLDKQGIETSLVVVEVKNPKEQDFNNPFENAPHYSHNIKPIFLLVTNGSRLQVLKFHRHRSDELCFDLTLDELRTTAQASAFYKQFHFAAVKQIKQQLTSELPQAHYQQFAEALEKYPQLQHILSKGEFEPVVVREGRRLTVVRPSVAIECDLPVAFTGDGCKIEFSSIMLRGLSCYLRHEDILRGLMTGLHTSPHWNTRRFLRKTQNGMFEAKLGQSLVVLSEQEAQDLCECVDRVCQQYKDIIIEASDMLDVWDNPPFMFNGLYGFFLGDVDATLWKNMVRFSHEFDYDNGDTEWHIFERMGATVRVCQDKILDNVFIRAVVQDIDQVGGNLRLIYKNPEEYFRMIEESIEESWKLSVGPKGFWTVKYTRKWLQESFIPQVLSYSQANLTLVQRIEKWFTERQVFKNPGQYVDMYEPSKKHPPFSEISEPKQLSPYLHDIQSWMHLAIRYGTTNNTNNTNDGYAVACLQVIQDCYFYGTMNISATLLRPYYAALTNLAKHVDHTTVNMGYIREKLGGIGHIKGQTSRKAKNLSTYNDVLHCLEDSVLWIHQHDYEICLNADMLSRVFISLFERNQVTCRQDELNAAIQAIKPLWYESRFARYYVLPLIHPSLLEFVDEF
jgi:hypothetical protein